MVTMKYIVLSLSIYFLLLVVAYIFLRRRLLKCGTKFKALDLSSYQLLKNFYPTALTKGMYIDFKKSDFYYYMISNFNTYKYELPSWLPCLQWLLMLRDERKNAEIKTKRGQTQLAHNTRIFYCKSGALIQDKLVLSLVDAALDLTDDASKSYLTEPFRAEPQILNRIINRLLIVEYEESAEWEVPIRVCCIEITPFYVTGGFESEDEYKNYEHILMPFYFGSYLSWVRRHKGEALRKTVNFEEEFFGLRTRLFEIGRG